MGTEYFGYEHKGIPLVQSKCELLFACPTHVIATFQFVVRQVSIFTTNTVSNPPFCITYSKIWDELSMFGYL